MKKKLKIRISDTLKASLLRFARVVGYGLLSGVLTMIAIPNFAETFEKNPRMLWFVGINACLGAIGKGIQEWSKKSENPVTIAVNKVL